MITLYDETSRREALERDLDPHLRLLLESRIASLAMGDHDLTDWTEITVVEPGDTEDDLIRELGFSPLVEPIEGARFGTESFFPFWDQLIDHDDWFEMVVSFGSTSASILFVPDRGGADANLVMLLSSPHRVVRVVS